MICNIFKLAEGFLSEQRTLAKSTSDLDGPSEPIHSFLATNKSAFSLSPAKEEKLEQPSSLGSYLQFFAASACHLWLGIPPQIGAFGRGHRLDPIDARAAICENKHGDRDFLYSKYNLIEPWWVMRNAFDDVPDQVNKWACGIVASARFLAMSGYPVSDFIQYHNEAPRYTLAHAEIGPGPERLWNHMISDGSLNGSNIGFDFSNDWETQKARIDDSVRLHRPILILYEVADRNLHWSVVIGQQKQEPHLYLVMDTDDTLFHMSLETIRERMDLKDHISRSAFAQSGFILPIERIERFNSISCTWYAMRSQWHEMRSYSAHERSHLLSGDHSALWNVARGTAIFFSRAFLRF